MFQDHPDTFYVSYRQVGGAGRPGSNSRVFICQNLSDSVQSDKLSATATTTQPIRNTKSDPPGSLRKEAR
jgi:hypothetical protein